MGRPATTFGPFLIELFHANERAPSRSTEGKRQGFAVGDGYSRQDHFAGGVRIYSAGLLYLAALETQYGG